MDAGQQQRRTITVRRARNSDLPEVTNLEALLDGSGFGTLTPQAEHKTLLHFVAVSDGRAVGTIRVARNPAGIVEVGRFVVDTAHRGRGIGSALLAMAVAQWPARTSLRATVHRDNTPTRDLLTRAGWAQTDEVPWDLPDNSTHALWAPPQH